MQMVNNLGNYVSPKRKNCLNAEVHTTRKYNLLVPLSRTPN